MHARRCLPFALVAVAVVLGCEPQKAAAPEAARARFAVGSVPYFAPPGAIAHGRDCITEFNRGAENGKPLAAPGRFTGVCKGNTLTFEAVPVARIVVIQSGGIDGKGLELDHTHPERTMWLTALPQDAAGAPLEHGEYGYAFWKPGPGCESVVRLETLAGESGNQQPADSIQVTAIAAGTCDVAIEYLGVHTSAKITVR